MPNYLLLVLMNSYIQFYVIAILTTISQLSSFLLFWVLFNTRMLTVLMGIPYDNMSIKHYGASRDCSYNQMNQITLV